MVDIIDWQVTAQVTVVVAAAMQILKAKSPFNRIDGEYLAAIVGILVAIYFCLVTPGEEVSWIDWMRCAASGLVAGIAASGAYNVQKALPFPNMLPSRTDKEAST
jgi:hypothetical protein